jgi:hypothetical protein
LVLDCADDKVFEAYREFIEQVASDAYDAGASVDDAGLVLVTSEALDRWRLRRKKSPTSMSTLATRSSCSAIPSSDGTTTAEAGTILHMQGGSPLISRLISQLDQILSICRRSRRTNSNHIPDGIQC